MRKTLVVVWILLSMQLFAAKHVSRTVNLYVGTQTPASGYWDQGYQARQDSVQDLIKIFHKDKKYGIASSPSDAQVKLYVLGRNWYEAGRISQVYSVRWTSSFFTTYAQAEATYGKIVYVLLQTPGGYEQIYYGYDASYNAFVGSVSSWRVAAGQIARVVDQWIRANSAKLAQEVNQGAVIPSHPYQSKESSIVPLVDASGAPPNVDLRGTAESGKPVSGSQKAALPKTEPESALAPANEPIQSHPDNTKMLVQPNEGNAEEGYADCGSELKRIPVSSSVRGIEALNCGERVFILSRHGNWIRIRTKDNQEGYVAARFISEAPITKRADQ